MSMKRVLPSKVNALREVQSPALRFGDCRCFARRTQSASREELRPFFGRTLMPTHGDATQSVLDRAFKGEL